MSKAGKAGSGKSKIKRGYPVPELTKKDQERISNHILRITQKLICDCCDLADIYGADRDNVIEHVWHILDHALDYGTFVGFNTVDARRMLDGKVKADVVR